MTSPEHPDPTSATVTTPAGVTVRAKAPAASTVSRALASAGHTRSVKSKRKGGMPSPGFVVRAATSTGSFVEVSATMFGLLPRYQEVLERAGFVVEDHPHRPAALAVFTRP